MSKFAPPRPAEVAIYERFPFQLPGDEHDRDLAQLLAFRVGRMPVLPGRVRRQWRLRLTGARIFDDPAGAVRSAQTVADLLGAGAGVVVLP